MLGKVASKFSWKQRRWGLKLGHKQKHSKCEGAVLVETAVTVSSITLVVLPAAFWMILWVSALLFEGAYHVSGGTEEGGRWEAWSVCMQEFDSCGAPGSIW